MAGVWFYSLDNEQKGPVDLETLKQLFGRGTVKPDALVWTQGMDAWCPAASIADLNLATDNSIAPVHTSFSVPLAMTPTVQKKSIIPWILGCATLAVVCVVAVVLLLVLIGAAVN